MLNDDENDDDIRELRAANRWLRAELFKASWERMILFIAIERMRIPFIPPHTYEIKRAMKREMFARGWDT